MVDHPQISVLEYDHITDGIYIGTNRCCEEHFDDVLKKEGMTADISLEDTKLDQPFGVDFYLWMPVVNHTPPSPDQLDFGVSALEKLVSMGRKVYVHCQNGHGRAPTMVAAYFISKGMSPDEAESFVQSKRPTMHLEGGQREALRDFARTITNRPRGA